MNIEFKKYHLLLLSLISGILMAAAWPERGFLPLIFAAWVPFLLLEDHISRNKSFFSRGAVVLYSYPGFLVWNLLTTWWVINSTTVGAILAFVLNALFMALVFGLFHTVKNYVFREKSGFIALTALWFSYEYLHMSWDLTWSWLNLGNVFATHPQWVQWYEFTGNFGGDLWIFAVNFVLFSIIKQYLNKGQNKKAVYFKTAILILFIVIPLTYSYRLYNNYEQKGEFAEVVVVQPDIDPYEEEFSTPLPLLLNNMLTIARTATDEKTEMVFFPETAIPHTIYESDFRLTYAYDSLRRFQSEYGNKPAVVIGLSTRKIFLPGEKPDVAARRLSSGELYASYNTAGFITPSGETDFYHKAKLVPGVERMPFPRLLKPLENLAIDLGGTSGSLGTSSERKVFNNGRIKAGTIICYESIYGEFVTGYVKKGANLLAVITNDGWWGDSPGYHQHFQYARLRAIETRRDIARAANTGISGFINQRGDVISKTSYETPAAVKGRVRLNEEVTVYVKYGDFLARIALFVSTLLILISISLKLRRK